MLQLSDFRLRSLAASDNQMVLEWRNSERVRVNMYNDHLIEGDEHHQWCARALKATDSCYLICEYQSWPIGFVSFSGIDRKSERCSWAFYLGDTAAPKGSGSAMEILALTYAFETLCIRKLCCEVLVFNDGVIRLHKKYGFLQEGYYVRHIKRGTGFEDVIALALFREDWATNKEALTEKWVNASKT